MTVVAETGVDALEDALALDEDVIAAIDEDVGDGLVGEQRLERAEAEDLVEQVVLDLRLLGEAQGNARALDDLVDHTGDSRAGLGRVDPRELLEIELRDQRLVYVGFVLLQIDLVHEITSFF